MRSRRVLFVTSADPPMFLYHGAAAWIVDRSQPLLLQEAVQLAEVPSTLYETRADTSPRSYATGRP